ncbi:ATP-binding protein [Peribacillus castrilensis]|uniref:ATP-binding protein n=1 Tax=Bacillaceae TaxID=186817 RepID=UPI0006607547|nr:MULTISPECIES: sensor histidine kinase [Bacillaceae]MCP1095749.1 sensor histidine kinase [Bacillaceae bacterium OS4b]MBD8586472.1 sensor histidine kinase [Peribacillus simplex]MCF7625066.1 sensor histidine kinase [Peribacillus frigoritolerans]MCP1155600.1 sensor histidine kinase [Peribacillus frigoritolerans]MCT1388186.1 sensor histidine kinase [Peribacillus frigoritolerans]
MRLHTKLMLGICTLIILMGGIFEVIFINILENNLKQETGEKALSVAQTISLLPEIKQAFRTDHPSVIIQPIAERIRRQIDAEFIVIGDENETRLSHPNPDLIGKKMVGGDNAEVWDGKSIITESTGTLGPSIRGKSPIIANEKVIGVVSVGYLQDDIEKEVSSIQRKIVLIISFILIGGLLVAFFISFNIKKAILGLEPKEIAWMFQEKHAILESIHEGIIAIDVHGKITVVNETAHKILHIPKDVMLRGQKIEEVITHTHLLDVVSTARAEYDQEFMIDGEVFLASRIPILNGQGEIIGAVASLRNKSELSNLLQELSHVKAYAEGLRAQTHEYSNRLYTLLGLIQLGSYKEAMDFISKEVDVTQGFLHFLMKEVPDPIIAGFILGKVSLASELKIDFTIDRESSFKDIPSEIDRDLLVTIIGNLINNAFEAVRENEREEKRVSLFVTDLGKELIIEVEDNGKGMSSEVTELIFRNGFTTKSHQTNSGIGLSLVQEAIDGLGGYITFSTKEGEYTIFTVAIPKDRGGLNDGPSRYRSSDRRG